MNGGLISLIWTFAGMLSGFITLSYYKNKDPKRIDRLKQREIRNRRIKNSRKIAAARRAHGMSNKIQHAKTVRYPLVDGYYTDGFVERDTPTSNSVEDFSNNRGNDLGEFPYGKGYPRDNNGIPIKKDLVEFRASGTGEIKFIPPKEALFERELERTDFKCMQECPACLWDGVFLMEEGLDENGYVMRVCSFCEHTWKQK